jgi:hypothetical protein
MQAMTARHEALRVGNVAGTYAMRYLDAGEVLAEGTFTLVK